VKDFWKAFAAGFQLEKLGWSLVNLEFERRTEGLLTSAVLRRGVPRLYGRPMKVRLPRTPRAFARRLADWTPYVFEFRYEPVRVRLEGLDWDLICSFGWFQGEDASWMFGLQSEKTRRRPDLGGLAKMVRDFGFNGWSRPHRMGGTLWLPIHRATARAPLSPFARRILRFLAELDRLAAPSSP
jgi:hypothetical protein